MKTEIERLKKSNPSQTAKDRFKSAALNVLNYLFAPPSMLTLCV